jgi:hypothetical protein
MHEKEADPAGNVYGITMGVVPLLCDLIGDIMNINDKIDECDHNGN